MSDSQQGLNHIAEVLTEEPSAPGTISLDQAPILGDQLLKVVRDDGEANTSGAGSVQDLQRRIEQVTLELQSRFDQQQERFQKRWCDLSFDEPDIEQDFRTTTFQVHRRYMYFMACLVMLYSLFAGFLYNVLPLAWLVLGVIAIPAFYRVSRLLRGFPATCLATALALGLYVSLTMSWEPEAYEYT